MFACAQIVHWITLLVRDVLCSLEDKPSTSVSDSNRSGRFQWDLSSRSARSRVSDVEHADGGDDGEDAEAGAQANFEPS